MKKFYMKLISSTEMGSFPVPKVHIEKQLIVTVDGRVLVLVMF